MYTVRSDRVWWRGADSLAALHVARALGGDARAVEDEERCHAVGLQQPHALHAEVDVPVCWVSCVDERGMREGGGGRWAAIASCVHHRRNATRPLSLPPSRTYLSVGRPSTSSVQQVKAPRWSQQKASTPATLPRYSPMCTWCVTSFSSGSRPVMPMLPCWLPLPLPARPPACWCSCACCCDGALSSSAQPLLLCATPQSAPTAAAAAATAAAGHASSRSLLAACAVRVR